MLHTQKLITMQIQYALGQTACWYTLWVNCAMSLLIRTNIKFKRIYRWPRVPRHIHIRIQVKLSSLFWIEAYGSWRKYHIHCGTPTRFEVLAIRYVKILLIRVENLVSWSMVWKINSSHSMFLAVRLVWKLECQQKKSTGRVLLMS